MRYRTPKPRRKAPLPVRSPAQPRRRGGLPEWETVKWKHQVEAEARHRLKRELHGDSVD
jgi:hypothetical protein